MTAGQRMVECAARSVVLDNAISFTEEAEACDASRRSQWERNEQLKRLSSQQKTKALMLRDRLSEDAAARRAAQITS